MPELLTKYPDVIISVLSSAPTVQCGNSAPNPQILTKCPKQQFCSFPQGEVCVYGPEQFKDMTQLKPSDILKKNCQNETLRKCSLCGSIGHIKSNKNYHPN